MGFTIFVIRAIPLLQTFLEVATLQLQVPYSSDLNSQTSGPLPISQTLH
jgi:hypothetical protein